MVKSKSQRNAISPLLTLGNGHPPLASESPRPLLGWRVMLQYSQISYIPRHRLAFISDREDCVPRHLSSETTYQYSVDGANRYVVEELISTRPEKTTPPGCLLYGVCYSACCDRGNDTITVMDGCNRLKKQREIEQKDVFCALLSVPWLFWYDSSCWY